MQHQINIMRASAQDQTHRARYAIAMLIVGEMDDHIAACQQEGSSPNAIIVEGLWQERNDLLRQLEDQSNTELLANNN